MLYVEMVCCMLSAPVVLLWLSRMMTMMQMRMMTTIQHCLRYLLLSLISLLHSMLCPRSLLFKSPFDYIVLFAVMDM